MMRKTNKVFASFLAMGLGWATMMTAVLIFAVFQGPMEDVFFGAWILILATGVVVLIAWVAVCLPVYCLIPANSAAFNWYIGGPIGAITGFCVGFFFLGGMIGGALAALVGGVAGGSGHLFMDRGDCSPLGI